MYIIKEKITTKDYDYIKEMINKVKDKDYKESAMEIYYTIEDKTKYYKFFEKGKLIGVIEGRKQSNVFYIMSFLVLEPKKWYGRKMFRLFNKIYNYNKYLLNSSIYAIRFWNKLAKEFNIEIN